jgi:hypothetical protein
VSRLVVVSAERALFGPQRGSRLRATAVSRQQLSAATARPDVITVGLATTATCRASTIGGVQRPRLDAVPLPWRCRARTTEVREIVLVRPDRRWR